MAEPARFNRAVPSVAITRSRLRTSQVTSQPYKPLRTGNTLPLRQSYKDMKANSIKTPQPIGASPSNTLPECPLDNIDPVLWPSFSRVSTNPDNDLLSLSYEEITEQRFSFDEQDLLTVDEETIHTSHIRHEITKGIKRAMTRSSNKIPFASIARRMPSPAFLRKTLRGGVDRNIRETPPPTSHSKVEPAPDNELSSKEPKETSDATGPVDEAEEQASTEKPPEKADVPAVHDSTQIADMIRKDLRAMRDEDRNKAGKILKIQPVKPSHNATIQDYDPIPASSTSQVATKANVPRSLLHNAQPVRRPGSSSSMLNIYARAYGRPSPPRQSINSYAMLPRHRAGQYSYMMSSGMSRPILVNHSHHSSSSSTVLPATHLSLPYLDEMGVQSARPMSTDSSTLVSRPVSSGSYGGYSDIRMARQGKRERVKINHAYYTGSHLARSAHRPRSAPAVAQRTPVLSEESAGDNLASRGLETFLELNKLETRRSEESKKAQTSNKDILARDIGIFEPASEDIKVPIQPKFMHKFKKWASQVRKVFPGSAGHIPELRKRRAHRFCLRVNDKLDPHARNLQLVVYRGKI